jgi:phosphatidylglycerophosphate synthase
VILECFETFAVTTCAICLESRAPLELAYIAPITSQTVAFIAIWQASRGLPERPAKHLADYLLTTGTVFSLISLLVLGLSLARLLDRLLYVQCGLFILSLTIGLRPTDPHARPSIPATWHQYFRRFTSRRSRHNSYQSLHARGPTGRPLSRPLPPPNAHVSGRSSLMEE